MKKKLYEKPTMQVVKLQHQTQLMQSSPVGNGGSMPGGESAEEF